MLLKFLNLINKKQLGAQKEYLARRYLIDKGLRHIESNYQTRFGEIDLIMFDAPNDILVFVEVRYRKTKQFGGAAASVTANKQAKLKKSALFYLAERQIDLGCRFDVLAIEGNDINWITNAFI